MDAVGPMVQGMKQGEQILHMLPTIQAFNFDRLKCQRRCTAADFCNQSVEMATRPDQNGDAFSRIIPPGLLNQLKNTTRLGLIGEFALGCNHGVNADPAIGTRRAGGSRFGIAHRAHCRAVLRRKNPRKGRIDPIDHGWK